MIIPFLKQYGAKSEKSDFVQPAFTLAEVIVTLALIGAVVAFSIPKIIQSKQDHEKLASFRQGISVLDTVINNMMTSDLWSANNQIDLFRGTNTYKFCDLSDKDGCWDAPLQDGPPNRYHNNTNWEGKEAGLVFPGGMQVVGLYNGGWCDKKILEEKHTCVVSKSEEKRITQVKDQDLNNGILLDWNGPKPPNNIGEDQLYVIYCVSHRKSKSECSWGPQVKVGNSWVLGDEFPEGAATHYEAFLVKDADKQKNFDLFNQVMGKTN